MVLCLIQTFDSLVIPSELMSKICGDNSKALCHERKIENKNKNLRALVDLKRNQDNIIKIKRVYDVIPSSMQTECKFDSSGRCRKSFFGK